MKNNDLESLFSDQVLEPSRKFDKALHAKLTNKHKSTFGVTVFKRAVALCLVTTLIFGVALFRPDSKEATKFVLLRSLVEKASADELATIENTNFWNIYEARKTGAQAPVCTNQAAGITSTKTTLLYKNATESAYFAKAEGDYPYTDMRYSADAETPTFDDEVFEGAGSSEVRQFLSSATLIDKDGNDLSADATTEQKTTGEYEVFARLSYEPSDTKNYLEGCSDLKIRVKIDAVSGLFTYIGVYNGALDDSALSFDITRKVIFDSYADFAAAEGTFIAAGFDRAVAEKFSEIANTTITNIAAGYSFGYSKPLFGSPSLTEQKNADGQVTAYVYTFQKHPEVVLRFYTKYATDIPDLKAKLASGGYEALTLSDVDMVTLPGYGQVPSSYQSIKDTQKKYGLNLTGSTDIPAAYVEAPIELGVYEPVDKNEQNFSYKSDDVLLLIACTVFLPNTEPPVGL